jgi:alkaline phosphatase
MTRAKVRLLVIMSQSRRGFFKSLGLFGAGSTIAVPGINRAIGGELDRLATKPRHIIQMVADGMSSGTLTLGDYFSRLTRKRGLSWMTLARQSTTVLASMSMRSLNSIVTDSAAAASSWGSGSRVWNGALNQLPNGKLLMPITSVVADVSWKRGLVTTTEITHATPAGFAVSVSSRSEADQIAEQYLAHGIEILLGGGLKYFQGEKRKDKRDLLGDYRRAGYFTMQEAVELDSAPFGNRWLGTFAAGHLPFSLDAAADARLRLKTPTLARMTEKALAKLEREDHFFLMVEGGRVDHGAHACDIAAAVNDLVAFDEALDVCVAFQQRVPDTLLVITSDHGTGNPGLNGIGDKYEKSSAAFENIRNVKRSAESLSEEITAKTAVRDVQRVLKEATGWAVPDKQAIQFADFLAGRWQPLLTTMNSPAAQLGQLLGNYVGVGWSGTQHTADYVPLLATGPGASRFKGFLQNTDVFPNYVELAGVDFRNPSAE